MPTGYTADLYEGKEVSFRDFVLRCARAMGAAVMLRDHTMEVVPTPENVTSGSSYYIERLLQVRADLARWEAMSPGEVEAETERYNNERREAFAEAVAKDARIKAAYGAMLQQVQAWEPPTEDHVGLKEFMIEQLASSIQHDCGVKEEWYATRTPDEHKDKTLKSLRRELARLEDDVEKETERNESRVEWVRALHDSLPSDPVADHLAIQVGPGSDWNSDQRTGEPLLSPEKREEQLRREEQRLGVELHEDIERDEDGNPDHEKEFFS